MNITARIRLKNYRYSKTRRIKIGREIKYMGETAKAQRTCYQLAEALKKISTNFYNMAKNGEYDILYNNYNVLESVTPDIELMINVFGFEDYNVLVTEIKSYFENNKTKEAMINNIELLKLIFLKLYEVSDAITLKQFKRCACCGEEIVYQPLSSYYAIEAKKYNRILHTSETLNKNEYQCPNCCSSDRDRLIVSFLERLEIQNATGDEKLLQIAPAKTIEHWIHGNCTRLQYDSTDLYMRGVTFNSDIQDMNMVKDGEYDYFVCSHVLEHVENDRKAMKELYRILNQDGIGLFLVPIALDMDCIDEEWGCSEAENWRRFGQGDHCRQYNKSGLIERLEEAGFNVNQLGIDYFGRDIFEQCGLEDKAILYVLTKDSTEIDKKIELIKEKRKKYVDSTPLVSVLLPTYNHEKYVAEAIESVLNQTYKNIEFLVADDGSTDGTVDIINKYRDKIGKLKMFDENTGGKTFRFLAKEATGKYVAIMHSDDLWEPNKIEMQVNYLENHPDIGACFTGVLCIDDSGNEVGNGPFVMDNMTQEAWIHYLFETGNHLCHPSVMIEKYSYIKLLFGDLKRPLRSLPDYAMWLQLLLDGNIHIIEKRLTYFRWHDDENANMSAPNKINLMRSYNEINYIWLCIMKKINKELFKKVFCDELVNKNVEDEIDVICEKLFVLMKRYKRASIQYTFESISNDECVLDRLIESYKFSKKQIFELTSQEC